MDAQLSGRGLAQAVPPQDKALTANEVRGMWPRMGCGNCGKASDGRFQEMYYDDGCELVLCGECRKKKYMALRALSAEAQFERKLGQLGRWVPGTHIPGAQRSMNIGLNN